MADSNFILEQIKNFVSIRDVFDKYVGTEPDMHGRYKCPFNDTEDRRNFAIKHNKMWHCFSCGSSGDQVTLVQKLFNLPFREAILKIAEDFNLAVEKDEKMSLRLRIECQRRLLQREKDKRYARFIEFKQNEIFRHLLWLRDILEDTIKKTDINTLAVDNCEKRLEFYPYTQKSQINIKARARLEKVNLYLDIVSEMPVEDKYDYEYPAFGNQEMHERAIRFVNDFIAGKIEA